MSLSSAGGNLLKKSESLLYIAATNLTPLEFLF